MKMNYDFGRLGLSDQNKMQYIKLLELNQNYFVPAKYSKIDKVSIEIEYDLTGLMSYEQLAMTNDVFVLQAMIGLTTLCTNSNEMFNVNLDRDNIYFDRSANGYQLVRELNPKQVDESKVVLEIKSLAGSMLTKADYESIHASNGELLNDDKLLSRLVEINDIYGLQVALGEIIDELLASNRTNKVMVDKNYVSKVKYISRFKTFVIIIFVVLSSYMALIFIPNRTSQLQAIDNYQAAKYEDVLSNLKNTNLNAMSPVMKFMMARSTVKLSQLSDSQKDNILFNLSPVVEENILDFWVYVGQGKLERAYDQSIKNNDAQQKAYVLLLLIDQTQNDTSLKTSEKEGKLSTYQGELDSITSSIDEDKTKA